MISRNVKIVLLAWFHIPLIGTIRPDSYQRSLQIDENILLQICKMRYCYDRGQDCNFQKCMEWLMQIDKYGDCPVVNDTMADANGCIDSRRGHDYRCLGIQKCCAYNCGTHCANPLELDKISDRTLPPIPQNITLINLERHRNIAEITWKMYYVEPPVYNLVFVLESRSHIGYYYDEQKLSNWFSMAFELTSSVMKYEKDKGRLMTNEFGANVRLRPGRWYQFRLSAVNGNGTRGYSIQSQNFQLKEHTNSRILFEIVTEPQLAPTVEYMTNGPKNPLPPRNFSIEVRPKLFRNNTVYTKAVWKPPRTNYPIDKYRIAWSLYLDSNNGSLWQNEAFVQEPIRHFEFWDLKPNSIYYLQIQALSSFGKKRSLKSPKESLLLNTSTSSNTTDVENIKNSTPDITLNQDTNKPVVTVRFIGSKKFGLLVRVTWPVQLIGSIIELCSGDQECLTKSTTKDLKLVRTKKQHFDFIELKFSTKYSFRLRKGGRVIFNKTFVTPSCSRFTKKHPQCFLKCT